MKEKGKTGSETRANQARSAAQPRRAAMRGRRVSRPGRLVRVYAPAGSRSRERSGHSAAATSPCTPVRARARPLCGVGQPVVCHYVALLRRLHGTVARWRHHYVTFFLCIRTPIYANNISISIISTSPLQWWSPSWHLTLFPMAPYIGLWFSCFVNTSFSV
jgi:hypothetical protein